MCACVLPSSGSWGCFSGLSQGLGLTMEESETDLGWGSAVSARSVIFLCWLFPSLVESMKNKLHICQDLLGSWVPLQLPQSRKELSQSVRPGLTCSCSSRRFWPLTCPAFLVGLTLHPDHPFFSLTEALHQSLLPIPALHLVLANHLSHVLAKSSHSTCSLKKNPSPSAS